MHMERRNRLIVLVLWLMSACTYPAAFWVLATEIDHSGRLESLNQRYQFLLLLFYLYNLIKIRKLSFSAPATI